ncbi:hypothetical protein AWB77_04090 [Caballeronia fortuita]|uniref:Uncharacterized protein n=1 Tax=Caballeronia fortuita TaxID=1777138 RepID=A0A158CI26_9BURK|nr:hypothetical protein AWB77_04090 [Caballeronia fortuita]
MQYVVICFLCWKPDGQGATMDLAMAMGVAMFALFGASTAVFLHQLKG